MVTSLHKGEIMLDKRLIWFPVMVVALYMFLPWLMARLFGIGSYSRGKTKGKVAFTFDDGPDPRYTPMLLDLLKQYQVKATFFVLGSRAEQYPDLIRRIHDEGHEIGIHNYTHVSNWILTPRQVRRKQIELSLDIVEQITGVRPVLYRPPWGIINLFDFRLPKSLTVVLWSVMGSDWSCSRPGDERKLADRLISRITHGSIVLLHDCGETLGAKPEAPKYMLQALRTVLEHLRKKGWDTVTVGEMMRLDDEANARCMSRTKKAIVAMWLKWERLFARMLDIRPVDEKNTFLKLRIRNYTGDHPIVLEDGEIIRKGDRIAELHLDNELLFQMGSTARSTMHLTVQMIRRMEQLMPQIMEMVLHDPDFRDVKGLYGISIIHRGPAKFGFTVIDMPKGVFSLLTKLYLRLLLYVIHPQGKERLKTKSELLVPKIIAISRRELINRYIA